MINYRNTLRQLVSREFWTVRHIVLFAIALIVISVTVFAIVRTQLAVVPIYEAQNHKVDTPFTITLNQRVKSLPLDKIILAPNVKGEWKLDEGSILTGDKLVFTPADYFAVNTQYTVAIPTIERAIVGTADGMSLQFKTEQAPSLTNQGLNALTDEQIIPADYAFTARLTSPNRGLRSLELRTDLGVELTQKSKDDQQFTWAAQELLPQGKTVKIELYDAKNESSLLTKTVRVADEPEVKAPEKTTHYRPGDQVELVFTQPIKSGQDTKITFDTPGEGSWKTDTLYAFTPQDMKAGKTLRYTISAGLRSTQGGIATKEHTGTVTTVGAVHTLQVTPQGRELAQASQRVSFTFDQPVDKASAVERFGITSGEITGTEWSGNTFTAVVKNLGYQKTITATIAPGVKNAGFGLPSATSFSVSFTTEPRTTRLAIPYFHQQYAASCTAASLRMILAYRGVSTSDMAIVERMGYNPRLMDKSSDPAAWDDPNTMFVGDVNGSIRGGTGAGPDAQPVAKAAQSFGRSATAVTGINTSWVAQQLHSGNPVVLFGAISGSGYVEWKTPSGAMTKMHVTGHARTVTGVVGEPQNPIGFWVSDPLYGSRYWTAGSLAANIALDPYRQAVVVY